MNEGTKEASKQGRKKGRKEGRKEGISSGQMCIKITIRYHRTDKIIEKLKYEHHKNK